MMGKSQGKMKPSSKSAKAEKPKVQAEQFMAQPPEPFGFQPKSSTQSYQSGKTSISEGGERQSLEGIPSMAEVSEQTTRRYGRPGEEIEQRERQYERPEKTTEQYRDIPSMAEVAHQPLSSQSKAQGQRSYPSIAEMAEPLVGGGEPVPSAAPSEGTATRSLGERADLDRKQAEQQKEHRKQLDQESSAYREGRPEFTAGREPAAGEQSSSKCGEVQREGLIEPSTVGAGSARQQQFLPAERARVGSQSYPSEEQSSPSMKEDRSLGRDQQERFERSGEPMPTPDLAGAEKGGRFHRQPLSTTSHREDFERFEHSGEPVLSPKTGTGAAEESAACKQQQRRRSSETTLGREQESGFEQQPESLRRGGVEQSSEGAQTGEFQPQHLQGQGLQRSGETQVPDLGSAEELGLGQGGSPRHLGSAGATSTASFGSKGFSIGSVKAQSQTPKGKQIPIAGESEQPAEEEQKQGSAVARPAERTTGQFVPREPRTEISGGTPSRRAGEPLQAGLDQTPGRAEYSTQAPSADEQARLFYSQGQGYRSPPAGYEQESGLQAGASQQQPSSYRRGESSPSQAERSSQTSPIAAEGGQFGEQGLSVAPSSIGTGAGLTSEFAKMKLPSRGHQEGLLQPSEPSIKSEREQQPGFSKGSVKETVGIGAESGRQVEYEYLPHPADVQFHAWGSTKSKSFEHMAECMFNYLADLQKVKEDPQFDFQFDVFGEDDQEVLYKFLDELLFRFNSRKNIICKRVDVKQIDHAQDGYRLQAVGHGEQYSADKHGSGTEIKAITLASLQVNEQPGRTDAFVIVDI